MARLTQRPSVSKFEITPISNSFETLEEDYTVGADRSCSSYRQRGVSVPSLVSGTTATPEITTFG